MKKPISGKPFLDTNVLIYAFGEADPRQETARMLLAAGGIIGVQALNEFVAVAKRKLRMSWQEIGEALSAIQALCGPVLPVTLDTHRAALQIAATHGYHFFDSLMIAAAIEGGCKVLYSEDMSDGHLIEGLTIRNPFRGQPN